MTEIVCFRSTPSIVHYPTEMLAEQACNKGVRDIACMATAKRLMSTPLAVGNALN